MVGSIPVQRESQLRSRYIPKIASPEGQIEVNRWASRITKLLSCPLLICKVGSRTQAGLFS